MKGEKEMANWDDTILKCSNAEAVKACVMAIKSEGKPYMRDGSDYQEGATEFYAVTAWGVPHEKIKEVSKQFPNDVITCRYSFDYDRFSDVHIVEYRNGDGEEVNIEPGYMSGHIPLNNDNDRAAIYEKAKAFCRKLDTTETDKDGKLFINWFDEKVCYTFEHNSTGGKKYRIEATKEMRNVINFKVYEGHIKYDWREITNNTVGEDIPF